MTMEDPGPWARLLEDLGRCTPFGIVAAVVGSFLLTWGTWARSGSPPGKPWAFVCCWVGGLIWIFGFEFKHWEDYTFWAGIGLVGIALVGWQWGEVAGAAPAAPPRREDAAPGAG